VPQEKRGFVSTLRQQCKNYPANPEGLRPKMLETIDAIEKDDRIWMVENRHAIEQRLLSATADQLKRIAEIIGYTAPNADKR
jgi:hypothetical protein